MLSSTARLVLAVGVARAHANARPNPSSLSTLALISSLPVCPSDRRPYHLSAPSASTFTYASTSPSSSHISATSIPSLRRSFATHHHPDNSNNNSSTADSDDAITSADGTMSDCWTEHEFCAVADASLDHISEMVGLLGFNDNDDGDVDGPDDFDVDLSQGVLTISLGSSGTYVINTQTPNRQLWLSSPVSGPWRYVWHPARCDWVSTRDGHSLAALLNSELSELFGLDGGGGGGGDSSSAASEATRKHDGVGINFEESVAAGTP